MSIIACNAHSDYSDKYISTSGKVYEKNNLLDRIYIALNSSEFNRVAVAKSLMKQVYVTPNGPVHVIDSAKLEALKTRLIGVEGRGDPEISKKVQEIFAGKLNFNRSN